MIEKKTIFLRVESYILRYKTKKIEKLNISRNTDIKSKYYFE